MQKEVEDLKRKIEMSARESRIEEES